MQTDFTENTDYSTDDTSSTISSNSRMVVIQTLLKVQKGLSLSALLDPLLTKVNPKDRAFIHALLLTTLRHWHATERLMDSMAKQPIEEIEVRTTIQVGMTQLLYLEVADHACIYETVEALKKINFGRASGLVNAILRKVSSNPQKYRKKCDKKHSLPNWLAWQLKQDWSDCYDELTASLRHSAPMFLRINARQTQSNEYAQLLNNEEIDNTIECLTTKLQTNKNELETSIDAIRLENSTSVAHLPHFDTGMASVQDIHAMLSGSLVHSLTHEFTKNLASSADSKQMTNQPIHILDACTAPSGKLAHCLELFDVNNLIKVQKVKVGIDSQGNNKYSEQHVIADIIANNEDKESATLPHIKITAIDSDQTRLLRSEQTLSRLSLLNEAKLVCGDATTWQESKTEAEQFDIILLDAPCTATGVIRRHPDISLLRQEGDIETTVSLQEQILDNLWKQLKPTGYLIYATCSLLKAENTHQMEAFIKRQGEAELQEIKLSGNWGVEQTIGRQCLPLDINGGDGFYYAVLQKLAN